jgi:hypothetical protein
MDEVDLFEVSCDFVILAPDSIEGAEIEQLNKNNPTE